MDVDSEQNSVERLRARALAWQQVLFTKRIAILREFRSKLIDSSEELAQLLADSSGRSATEILASEVLPVAAACQFLEKNAARLLQPRTIARGYRVPLTGWGAPSIVEHREPWGVVLVIGPSNYPIFLSMVPALQALISGNSVVLKPGRGGAEVLQKTASLLRTAGLPEGLLLVTDEEVEQAVAMIDQRPDRIVFTGSYQNGCAVLEQAAKQAIPTTVELSGCDAVFVREDADIDLVTRALMFGLTINQSRTCIAPRRVLAHREIAARLETEVKKSIDALTPVSLSPPAVESLAEIEDRAVEDGVRKVAGTLDREQGLARPFFFTATRRQADWFRDDVFAPVLSMIPVRDDEEALSINERCPYALGASVFSADDAKAEQLAEKIPAGSITINDLIAPTADPRVSFGGRKDSGFGVTRGARGLLEMTSCKTVMAQRAERLPHLDGLDDKDAPLVAALGGVRFGNGWKKRLRSLVRLVSLGRKRGN